MLESKQNINIKAPSYPESKYFTIKYAHSIILMAIMVCTGTVISTHS